MISSVGTKLAFQQGVSYAGRLPAEPPKIQFASQQADAPVIEQKAGLDVVDYNTIPGAADRVSSGAHTIRTFNAVAELATERGQVVRLTLHLPKQIAGEPIAHFYFYPQSHTGRTPEGLSDLAWNLFCYLENQGARPTGEYRNPLYQGRGYDITYNASGQSTGVASGIQNAKITAQLLDKPVTFQALGSTITVRPDSDVEALKGRIQPQR